MVPTSHSLSASIVHVLCGCVHASMRWHTALLFVYTFLFFFICFLVLFQHTQLLINTFCFLRLPQKEVHERIWLCTRARTEVPLLFVCMTLVALVPRQCCRTKTVVSAVTKAAPLSFSPLLSSAPPPSLFSHTPPLSSSPCWVVNGVRVLAGVRADASLCPWPLASSQATHDHLGGERMQSYNSGMRVFVVGSAAVVRKCSYRSGQMIQ